MRTHNRKTWRGLWVGTCAILMFAHMLSAQDYSIGNYQVVGSTRVGRTLFDYQLQATLTNSTSVAQPLAARVTSSSSNTLILQPFLFFGEVGAGTNAVSTNTITIQQDREFPFDPNALQWTIVPQPLALTITSPANGTITNASHILIQGTVSDPGARVAVQNVLASLSNSTFTSAPVTLSQGQNVIQAIASDPFGGQAATSITVTLATNPPIVTILSPSDQSAVGSNRVAVIGIIQDSSPVTCAINGQTVPVSSGGFTGLASLAQGPNLLSVVATDAAGNSATQFVTVFFNANPLAVVGINPTNGSQNVQVAASVVASFSSALQIGSVGPSTFFLSSGGAVYPADVFPSSDGMSARLVPAADLPQGSAITVTLTTGIKDSFGNPLLVPFTSTFATAGTQAWSGLVSGTVYDDSRSLPLAGATAAAYDPTNHTLLATVQTDSSGNYLLTPGQSSFVIRVTNANFTVVDRPVTNPQGQFFQPVDARLTPLAPTQLVSAVSGATLTNLSGAQLVIPSGALSADTGVSFTAISGQGPRNLFPLGWAPVGMADICTTQSFSSAASLIFPNSTGASVGTTAVLARFDQSTEGWLALANCSLSNVMVEIDGVVTNSGEFALLVPDSGTNAPPVAVLGQLLNGSSAIPLPADASGSGVVQPSSRLANNPTPANATVTISSASPMQSGTLLQGDFTELYLLTDGNAVAPLDTAQDLWAYRTPGDPFGTNIFANFAIAPSQVFPLTQINQGTITVEISPQPVVQRNVIGTQGGGIQLSDGTSLLVPNGAFGSSVPIIMRRLDTNSFVVPAPAGLTFIGGVELNFAGQVSAAPLTLSLGGGASQVSSLSQIVVAEIENIFGVDRLVFVTMAQINGTALTTITSFQGVTMPGVRTGGRYGFFRYDGPLAPITGTAQDSSGRLDGHLITVNTFPFVAVTDPTGAFTLVAPPGPFNLTATGAVIHDYVTVSGTTGQQLPLIIINPSPPQVTNITVAPAPLAGNFAGPVVLLGNPQPAITDAVTGTNVTQIAPGEAVSLTLSVRNNGNVPITNGFFAFLVRSSGQLLPVTPATNGVPVLAPATPTQIGPFVFTAPAIGDPAQLQYSLEFFTSAGLSTVVPFQLPLGVDDPDVSVNSQITVQFSEPVLAASLNNGCLLYQESPSGLVAVSTKLLPSTDGTMVTVRPLNTLLSDTTYQLQLTAAITNSDGRTLANAPVTEAFQTQNLTPPTIAPGQIEASVPNTNGYITITGSLGSVDPNDTVIVLDETSGFTVLATVQSDGSFSATLPAQSTDLIEIIIKDPNNNETDITITTLVRRDPVTGEIISEVIGKSGGTVTSSDGNELIVPNGALAGPTELSVSDATNEFALPPDVAADTNLTAAFNSLFEVVANIQIGANPPSLRAPIVLGIPAPDDATTNDLYVVVRSQNVNIGGTLADLDQVTGIPPSQDPIVNLTRLQILDTAALDPQSGNVVSSGATPFPGITGSGVVTVLKVLQPLTFFTGQVTRDYTNGIPFAQALLRTLPPATGTTGFVAISDFSGRFVLADSSAGGPYSPGVVAASRLDVMDPKYNRIIRQNVRGDVGSPSQPNLILATLEQPFVLPSQLPTALLSVLGDITPPVISINISGPSYNAGLSRAGDPLTVSVTATDMVSVSVLTLSVNQGNGFVTAPLSANGTYQLTPTNDELVTFQVYAADPSNNVSTVTEYVRVVVAPPGAALIPGPIPGVPPVVLSVQGQPAVQPGTASPQSALKRQAQANVTPHAQSQSQNVAMTDYQTTFDGDFVIGFSQPVTNTVDASDVLVYDPDFDLIQYNVTLEQGDTVIRVHPLRYLRMNATYTVELDDIEGVNGVELGGFSYTFSAPPPKVITLITNENTEDVAMQSGLLVAVNHPNGTTSSDQGQVRVFQVVDNSGRPLPNPSLIGSNTTLGRPISIAIDGSKAFVGNRFLGPIATMGTEINFNVPGDTFLGGFDFSSGTSDPTFTENYTSFPDPPSNLEEWDLSNPTNPQRVTGAAVDLSPNDWDPNSYPQALGISQQRVGVLNFLENLQFFTPLAGSNPSLTSAGFVGQPRSYGEYFTTNQFEDAAFFDSYAVVMDESVGLRALTTSQFNNPTQINPTLAKVETAELHGWTSGARLGGVQGFKWTDGTGKVWVQDLVFVATLDGFRVGNLTIYDATGVQVLGEMNELSELTNVCGNISIDAGRGLAYIHGFDGSFHVIDFNNPFNPVDLNNPDPGLAPFALNDPNASRWAFSEDDSLAIHGNANAAGIVYLAGDYGITVVQINPKLSFKFYFDQPPPLQNPQVYRVATDGSAVVRVTLQLDPTTSSEYLSGKTLSFQMEEAGTTRTGCDFGALFANESDAFGTSPGPTTVTPQVDTSSYPFTAYAFYRPPSCFRCDQTDLPKVLRRLSFEAYVAGGERGLGELDLVRPPILLVHGYRDSAKLWNLVPLVGPAALLTQADALNGPILGVTSLIENGGTVQVPQFQFFAADYQSNNQHAFTEAAFEVQTQSIAMLQQLQQSGTAVQKFDVVCHSMGAPVTRTLVGDSNGPVRRWISLDGVNLGAMSADCLFRYKDQQQLNIVAGDGAISFTLAQIAGFLGFAPNAGAVQDMQTLNFSSRVPRMAGTSVHAICGALDEDSVARAVNATALSTVLSVLNGVVNVEGVLIPVLQANVLPGSFISTISLDFIYGNMDANDCAVSTYGQSGGLAGPTCDVFGGRAAVFPSDFSFQMESLESEMSIIWKGYTLRNFGAIHQSTFQSSIWGLPLQNVVGSPIYESTAVSARVADLLDGPKDDPRFSQGFPTNPRPEVQGCNCFTLIGTNTFSFVNPPSQDPSNLTPIAGVIIHAKDSVTGKEFYSASPPTSDTNGGFALPLQSGNYNVSFDPPAISGVTSLSSQIYVNGAGPLAQPISVQGSVGQTMTIQVVFVSQ